MEGVSLAPGFRFRPTDAELIMFYLKRKVLGKKFFVEAISELNIYKFVPWDLPDKSCHRRNDLEWYFFCPREKKYLSGSRTNRITEAGYWKSTGKDRPVIHHKMLVGSVKTLVFHIGRAPRGERTNWFLYEYRLEDKNLTDAGIVQDAYVICKVFKKSGLGSNNGAQYGTPFNEEDWNDEEEVSAESLPSDGPALSLCNNQENSIVTDTSVPKSTPTWSCCEPSPSSVVLSYNKVSSDVHDYDEDNDNPPIQNNNNIWPYSQAGPSSAVPRSDVQDNVALLLAPFTEDYLAIEKDNNKELRNLVCDKSTEAVNCTDQNAICNGLGDQSEFNFSSSSRTGNDLNPMFPYENVAYLDEMELDMSLNWIQTLDLEDI